MESPLKKRFTPRGTFKLIIRSLLDSVTNNNYTLVLLLNKWLDKRLSIWDHSKNLTVHVLPIYILPLIYSTVSNLYKLYWRGNIHAKIWYLVGFFGFFGGKTVCALWRIWFHFVIFDWMTSQASKTLDVRYTDVNKEYITYIDFDDKKKRRQSCATPLPETTPIIIPNRSIYSSLNYSLRSKNEWGYYFIVFIVLWNRSWSCNI